MSKLWLKGQKQLKKLGQECSVESPGQCNVEKRNPINGEEEEEMGGDDDDNNNTVVYFLCFGPKSFYKYLFL